MQDGCFYANTFSQVSYESFEIKYNLNEWLDIFNTNKELKNVCIKISLEEKLI